MKKLLSFCVMFIFVINITSGQKLLKSFGKKDITIEFNVSSIKFEDVEEIKSLIPIIENGTPIQIKGTPDLPKLTATIAIADDEKMIFEILDAKYKEYKNIDIAPSKGIITRDQDPTKISYTYGKYYEKDAFFPGKLVELKEPFIQRKIRGQAIWVYPLQYNPVNKTLRVYTKLVVRVYSSGQKDTKNIITQKIKNKTTTPGFEQIFEKTFINYKNLKYTPIEEGTPGRMLIICYDDFLEEIQPFVDWKKQKGIETEVLPVSSIGNNANSIKSYVQNYFDNNNDFCYLLLVGDGPQVSTSSTSAGDSDNDYGYLVGNDHRIDIFVGRFSAETEQQVITQVERTIHYERDIFTNATWLNYGLGIASDEGTGGYGDDGESDAQHMDNIKSDLLNYGYSDVYSVYQSTGATSTNITNYINSGLGVINYVGHGSVTSWYSVDPNQYTISMVEALNNPYHLPFIWTVACVVGDFVNNYCFSESWVRSIDNNGNPIGAVAVIGSTINQSWASPMDAQDEMVDILIETYPNNLKRTFGGLIANGWGHMIDEYGNDGENMADTWTCFGDPSLMVRTKVPDTMIVTHNTSILQGATNFTIQCDAEGALVSITHNNDILGTDYIISGSTNVDFSAPITFTDSILVTVTAYNKTTYQKYVPVITTTDPPIAGFYAAPTVITQGEYVQFYDTSLNYPNQWFWEFEGATTTTSNQMNPTIQYLTPGVYDVKLVVTNNNGTDSILKIDYITVNPVTNPPVADFEANQTTITVGETVSFTDLSTNLPDSWYWEFEGGTPSSSTDQNPTVTYNTPGDFTVTLTATNSYGSNTITKTNYITVTLPEYCDASASNQYEYISNVSMGSINNSSSWGGYEDYSSMSTVVYPGDNVNVSVSISNLYFADVLYVWADWNRDGDFYDTGELVYQNDNDENVYNFTINVPPNISSGTIRVRFRLNDTYNDPTTEPCGTTSYGEVEDYSLYVDIVTNDNFSKNNNNFIVYPNPVKSNLHIQTQNVENSITLFDMYGKKVVSKTIGTNGIINVSNLPAGIYMLVLKNNKNVKTIKIIKE